MLGSLLYYLKQDEDVESHAMEWLCIREEVMVKESLPVDEHVSYNLITRKLDEENFRVYWFTK